MAEWVCDKSRVDRWTTLFLFYFSLNWDTRIENENLFAEEMSWVRVGLNWFWYFVSIYMESTNNLILDLGKNLSVGEQQILFIVDLDWRSTERGNQHIVAGFDDSWFQWSILVWNTWTSGNHRCLVQLLHVLLGNVDTRSSLGGGLSSLNENSVQQWLEWVGWL